MKLERLWLWLTEQKDLKKLNWEYEKFNPSFGRAFFRSFFW